MDNFFTCRSRINDAYHELQKTVTRVESSGKFYFTGYGSHNESVAISKGFDVSYGKLEGCQWSNVCQSVHSGQAVLFSGVALNTSQVATVAENNAFWDIVNPVKVVNHG